MSAGKDGVRSAGACLSSSVLMVTFLGHVTVTTFAETFESTLCRLTPASSQALSKSRDVF